MEKKKNIIIILDKIRHEKETSHEAIGVKKEEIDNCARQICAEHNTFGDIMKHLKLSGSEIRQALREVIDIDKPKLRLSKAIVRLWKKKGIKKITIGQYIATEILMRGMIDESEKELALIEKELASAKKTLEVIQVKVIPIKAIPIKMIPRTLQNFD
ncbi:hypothetical protein KJA15_01345 [Patescibacteria group bacterium]|nr:hypothetical protein [Patescibacteria group bacterium]